MGHKKSEGIRGDFVFFYTFYGMLEDLRGGKTK